MPGSSEKRQVVRYAFYKLDPAWRRLTAERQASAKLEFGETLERYHGRLLLRPYGLVGIRGDCDFLLWHVAEDLDALVELQTALNRTALGAYLSIPYSYLAMPRRSIYEFPADPGHEQRLVIQPSAAKYLFVYPFIKTRPWYALPKPERQRMMDEHVRVGRKYPTIRLNTTYSYGLDDQEFIVAFEGDNPGEFLDLVMELRESEASSYTLRDTPTFTCVQMSLWDMLDTLGGAGAAQAVSRRPTRADGYTPVATLADLPAGGRAAVAAGAPPRPPPRRQGPGGVRGRRCRRALQRERHGARHRQPLHARARQSLRGHGGPGPLRRDVPLARRRVLARDRTGAGRAAVAPGRHLSREGRGRHGPRRSPRFDRRGRADRCPTLLTTAASSRRAARSPPM